MENILTIGIPKGSLQDATAALFGRAGFSFLGAERSLWLTSNDPELKPVLLRPQEIPIYVANGSLDCGLSGLDWITETNSNDQVRRLADLCYSKRSFRPVRWVLAVANQAKWKSPMDLKDIAGKRLRISTELQTITENWLAERGIIADVSFSWGATEAKVPVFADAIVECTETGASLRANGLRVLDTVFESTTQFFANKKTYNSDAWKRGKIGKISVLLKSCLAADKKVSLRVEAPRAVVDVMQALIPSTASFSVLDAGEGKILIEIVAEKEQSRDLLPRLARNGASRISVLPLGLLFENDMVLPG